MIFVLRICVVLLILTTAFSVCHAADSCLRIGVPTGGAFAQETALEVSAIFAKATLCVHPVMAPQIRIDVMETEGGLDGDAWRDQSYIESHPYLTKIPTPVQHFSASLYWHSGLPEPADHDATIGVLLGRGWAQQALQGLPVKLFEATSYEQLILLARSGRIQGFVMPTLTYQKLIAESPQADHFATREILNRPLYLAINRRHKSLIPAIDGAITALWSAGIISDLPPHAAQ